MSQFLPDGYESLKTDKAYWKMSQMKAGDNRLRIVMQPIAGWLDWKDAKPYRFKPENKPARPFDANKPLKAFWSCYVWDYARESLFILEITQASILKSLTKIANDEDWGDFLQYDIKIGKEGSGKETRYVLTPLPHKPLSEKIKEALKKAPVRLDALYEGGDPWTDLIPSEEAWIKAVPKVDEVIKSSNNAPLGTGIDDLKNLLEAEDLQTEFLEAYINELAEKKNQLPIQIVGAALMPQLFSKFKAAYSRDLAKRAEQLQTVSA